MVFDKIGIYNFEYVNINVRLSEWEIMLHIFRISHRGADDRHTRLLGDLEGAGVEGLELFALGPCPLRIYNDGGIVLINILRGLLHGFERFPVVLPVKGQAAALMHDLAGHGDPVVAGL